MSFLRALFCPDVPKRTKAPRSRPVSPSLHKPLPPPPPDLKHPPAFAFRIRVPSFPAGPRARSHSALAANFPGCALVDAGRYAAPIPGLRPAVRRDVDPVVHAKERNKNRKSDKNSKDKKAVNKNKNSTNDNNDDANSLNTRIYFIVDPTEPEGPRAVKAAMLVVAGLDGDTIDAEGRDAAEREWRSYIECMARQGVVEHCVALLAVGGEARAWRFEKGGGFVEQLGNGFSGVVAELDAVEARPRRPLVPVLRVTQVGGEWQELE